MNNIIRAVVFGLIASAAITASTYFASDTTTLNCKYDTVIGVLNKPQVPPPEVTTRGFPYVYYQSKAILDSDYCSRYTPYQYQASIDSKGLGLDLLGWGCLSLGIGLFAVYLRKKHV